VIQGEEEGENEEGEREREHENWFAAPLKRRCKK
jgi:hypothetical protein